MTDGLKRRAGAVVALASALLLSAGCGGGLRSGSRSRAIGERIPVGALAYTVLDAEWKNEIGSGSSTRMARNRFLIVDMTIENTARRPASIPLFEVENADGKRFLETDKVLAFEQWMGLLREIKPMGALRGKLVFDLEPASYRLRVTDAGDGDNERVRFIQIPFRAGAGSAAK